MQDKYRQSVYRKNLKRKSKSRYFFIISKNVLKSILNFNLFLFYKVFRPVLINIFNILVFLFKLIIKLLIISVNTIALLLTKGFRKGFRLASLFFYQKNKKFNFNYYKNIKAKNKISYSLRHLLNKEYNFNIIHVNLSKIFNFIKYLINLFIDNFRASADFRKRTVSIALMFLFLFYSFFLFNTNNVAAATYFWFQDNWSGGLSNITANHDENQNGLTTYKNKDNNVNASDNLKLNNDTVSITESSDSDFDSGELNNVVINGSGDDADLMLGLGDLPFTDWSKRFLSDVNLGSGAKDVAVQGDFVYLAIGSSVKIINVSNISSPEVVFTFSTGSEGVNSVFIYSNRLYIGTAAALRIVDITNPYNPVQIGSSSGLVYDVVVDNMRAYVGTNVSLKILDVSNPADIVLLGTYNAQVSSISLDGDIIYLSVKVSGVSYFRILNVSNPASLVTVGSLSLSNAKAIEVKSGFAYIGTDYGGLYIVDCTNQSAPSLLTKIYAPQSIKSVYINGDYLYLASDSNAKLKILNISNPLYPFLVGANDDIGSAYGVIVVDGQAFVADFNYGLKIFDVNNIVAPYKVAEMADLSSHKYSTVLNDKLYLSKTNFSVVDVSDPSTPNILGSLAMSYPTKPFIKNNLAYITDYTGLSIVDISNPAQIYLLNHINLGNNATQGGVVVSGDYAFVTRSTSGVYVVDIKDAQSISVVDHLDIADARSLDISADYLFVGDYNNGLKVIDISSPSDISVVAEHALPVISDLVFNNNLIYLVTASNGVDGLRVLNVENPTNPILLSYYSVSGNAIRQLNVLGNFLYLSDSAQGVKIFDVSDPLNIFMLTNISNFGATSAFADGNYLYVSDGNGLSIFRVKEYSPEGWFVSQVFDSLNSEYGQLSWSANTLTGTSLSVKVRSSNNASMSGASDWSNCNTISNGEDISESVCVIDGQRYFQYQIYLSTNNLDHSPRIHDLSFDYKFFKDGSLESLPYDSGSDFNLIAGVSWIEDEVFPYETGISLSIRSASLEEDLNSVEWTVVAESSADFLSDNCTKDGELVVCDQNALPESFRDGVGDRWFQYKINLKSYAFFSPMFDDFKLSYVVNAPPELKSITAYQSNDGLVYISYDVRDPDTQSGSLTPGEITPFFEYWTGSSWVACSSMNSGATSTKPVDETDFKTYQATWSPVLDFDEQYLDNEAKIRITINDNEAANNINILESPVFTLDTKDPVVESFIVDARVDSVDNLKINIIDDSVDSLELRFSNNNNLSSDGKNLDSGQWISYVSSKHWLFNTENTSVYYQVRDKYGNISNGGNVASGKTPIEPQNILYQDVSSIATSEWREFIAWGESSEPISEFKNYLVYRSSNGSDYEQIYIQPDKTVNFLIDNNLETNLTYYYRVVTEDTNGNISPYSDVINDRPDGQGGSDLTPPDIYNVQVESVNTQSAKISWETDEISDSLVEYIDINDGNFDDALGVGVASMLDNENNLGKHEVILTGLLPNQTYYFRVKSTDPNSNTAVGVLGSEGYSFTTITGPIISSVNVSEIANNQAMISWETDVPSDSYVFYTVNPGPSFDYQAGLVESVTDHSVILNNLTKGTTYYFYVKSGVSEDRNIIEGQMNYFSFTTTADNIIPIIFFDPDVNIRNLNDNSVQISWTTSKQTNSQIEYGFDDNYGNSLVNSNYNINHVYDLNGLIKGTTYYVRLNNIDANGNRASEQVFTFITTDTTDYDSPIISEIIVDPIFDTSVIIDWKTDEPANSLVEYGLEPGIYTASSTSSSFNVDHSQIIQGLNIKTTYYYRVISDDVNGNHSFSDELFFTTKDRLVPQEDVNAIEEAARTDGAKNSSSGGGGVLIIDKSDKIPPIITDVSIDTKYSEATFKWFTDEPADSFVEYGLSKTDLSVSASRILLLEHSLSVQQLTPNSQYYYNISSADSSGNLSLVSSGEFNTGDFSDIDLIGDDAQIVDNNDLLNAEDQAINDSKFVDVLKRTVDFIKKAAKNISLSVLENSLNEQQKNLQELSSLTPSPQLVSGPNVKTWEDMAIIYWDTDKKTNSLITLAETGFGIDNAKNSQTIGNPDVLSTQHQVVVSGLKAETTYDYQLKGSTSIGANLISPISRFTTEAKTAKVENYAIDVINESSASFKWSTSFPTNSSISITPYRNNVLAVDEEKIFSNENTATLHEMTVDSFEPGIFYKINLFGSDYAGRNLNQSIDIFSTSDREVPLLIDQIKTDSALSMGSNSQVQSIITWSTTKPSTSKIYYRKGINKESDIWSNETILDENYTRRHIVVITNFEPGEIYQFQVESIDSNGLSVRSKTHTILAPRQKESVFQIIIKNIEETFGWVNAVRK